MNDISVGFARQRGAVLLVSLVLLVVMTLLGLSAMETSGTQMKMASVSKDRQEAFEYAEQTLSVVERQIESGLYDVDDWMDCVSGSAGCFDDTCAGGLCFDGEYTVGDTEYDCDLDSTSDSPVNVWKVDTNWSSASKHLTLPVASAQSDPKYLLEFLCYVERGDTTVFDDSSPSAENSGSPYLRITARAISNSGKAEVMLQSTYRWNGA